MNLDVLVLAAGKSTRIAGISGGLPKPLLKVGDRSIIEHNLEWLASAGVASVWINLHYRPGDIKAALGDGGRFGLSIRYSHEDEILGTAGAWKLLAPRFGGRSLVVYGDNLLRFDLHRLLSAHEKHSALATVALFDRNLHSHTGIAGGRVDVGADGRVRGFIEGPAAGEERDSLVNAGAYVLEPEVARFIGDGFQDFARDVFPGLLAQGRMYGHVLEPEGFCLGLDTPESFATAQQLILSREVQLQ